VTPTSWSTAPYVSEVVAGLRRYDVPGHPLAAIVRCDVEAGRELVEDLIAGYTLAPIQRSESGSNLAAYLG
jgi:hypothetical protein